MGVARCHLFFWALACPGRSRIEKKLPVPSKDVKSCPALSCVMEDATEHLANLSQKLHVMYLREILLFTACLWFIDLDCRGEGQMTMRR